jgi:hypothetical protein
MGILNTITKTVMTLGLVTAPIMLAAGLGFIEDCPAALIKGNGGTGADKAEWGAAPGAGGWPQTVISSLAKGACCGCCTTPKALAVAALQRLWRGPRCHPATSAKLLQSGAAFLGTTRANVLILLGACKLLALLDLWVLNAMPRITCLCVAVMMGAHRAHPLASRHLLLYYWLREPHTHQ